MNRKRGYPIRGEASTGVVFFLITGAMCRTYGACLFWLGAQGLRPGLVCFAPPALGCRGSEARVGETTIQVIRVMNPSPTLMNLRWGTRRWLLGTPRAFVCFGLGTQGLRPGLVRIWGAAVLRPYEEGIETQDANATVGVGRPHERPEDPHATAACGAPREGVNGFGWLVRCDSLPGKRFRARRGGHAWRRGLCDANFTCENFVFCFAGDQRYGADAEAGDESDGRVSAAIQL